MSRSITWMGMGLCAAAMLAGCVSSGPDDGGADEVGTEEQALVQPVTSEDGLAEAFQVFTQNFIADGQDQAFTMGFGFHEGIVTRYSARGSKGASTFRPPDTLTMRPSPPFK